MGNHCVGKSYDMAPQTSIHGVNMGDENPNRLKIEDIESSYELGRLLGDGRSAKVYEGWKRSDPNQKYAIKIIPKSLKPKGSAKKAYFREIDLLTPLQHSNILRLIDNMQNSKYYYIVTQLLTGGELFDRIIDRKYKITEKKASNFIKQMLLALKVCHKHNIVHRDLKPENFVFSSKDEDSDLVLIDFGAAMVVEDDKLYKDFICTPTYASPEVAAQGLGRTLKLSGAKMKASDIWAIGAIAFVMLTGSGPFDGNNSTNARALSNSMIYRNIIDKKLEFPGPNDRYPIILSHECKDFISKCLNKDYMQRMTLSDALEHPWINVTTDKADDIELNKKVIQFLRQFNYQTQFKRVITQSLIWKTENCEKSGKTAQNEQIGQMDSSESVGTSVSTIAGSDMHSSVRRDSGNDTNSADSSNSSITITSVDSKEESPVEMESSMAQESSGSQLSSINTNNLSTVSKPAGSPVPSCSCEHSALYEDFITQTQHHFNRLDKSETGLVGESELFELLEETGFETEEVKNEISKILAHVDTDKDGKIDFIEFRTIWLRKLLKRKQFIRIVFDYLDTKGDGEIDAIELQSFLGNDFDAIIEMMKEVDKDGNSKISFEEFSQAMMEKIKDPKELPNDKYIKSS